MPNAGDHKVLSDMVANGGRVQMTSDAEREIAWRLVELGFAEFVPLSMKIATIEITARGRTAKILADFGIWNPDFCAIERQPSEMNGKWMLKVSTVRGAVCIDTEDASGLVAQLMDVGATGIARQFHAEIERARRYGEGRLHTEMQQDADQDEKRPRGYKNPGQHGV
jgi:hypothetical protein